MDYNRIRIIRNFISEQDCAKAIEIIDRFDSLGALEEFNANEVVKVVPDTHAESNVLIKKYSDKLLSEHKSFHNFLPELFTVEGWLSLWTTGAKGVTHTDSHEGYEFALFSSVAYFNDDYEGGEIFFPNQGVFYKPTRGDVVLFPCGGQEYLHGVKPVFGRRYTLPFFHTARPDMASPILHPGIADAVEKMPSSWYYDGWGITDNLNNMTALTFKD